MVSMEKQRRAHYDLSMNKSDMTFDLGAAESDFNNMETVLL